MSGYVVESPNRQRAAESRAGRVRDVPRPNFLLYYHPAEWQLTAEGELTPSISHMSLAPGAGADEKGNFDHRHAELTTRGYLRIPHDVLGEALDDYVAKYTNHRGKSVHRTVFQKPYDDGTGTTRWRADTEAIRAFVKFLRKRGVVARPRPEVVEGMLHAQQRALNRLLNVRTADAPRAKRRHEEKIQAAEQAITYLQGELQASADVYGRPEASARSVLLELLDEGGDDLAVDEDAEEVARVVNRPPRRRSKKKAEPTTPPEPLEKAPPADPDSGFAIGDEDLE